MILFYVHEIWKTLQLGFDTTTKNYATNQQLPAAESCQDKGVV